MRLPKCYWVSYINSGYNTQELKQAAQKPPGEGRELILKSALRTELEP